MDKPFFAVIIPTYNRGQLLRKSIESVIAQTYTNWQLLVVDDGSTDNTKEVVESYKDNRIKYIYQQNAERSAARNNGIKNATADYICFLDSDDYYTPDRLLKLHGSIIAKGSPIAFFYTAIAFDRPNGIWQRPELERKNESVFDFIVQAIIGNPQVCIHRNIVTKYQYNPAFTIAEDMELWLRVAAEYEPEYLPNQYTVIALDHDDRSVNVKRYNSFAKQLEVVKHIITPPHPGVKMSDSVKKFLLSRAYFGIARFYIFSGNKGKAISNMMLAITSDLGSKYLKFRINVLLHLLNPFISNKKIEQLVAE